MKTLEEWLNDAILDNNFQIVKMFIDMGADVNNTCNKGLTPLVIAISEKHYKIAELLKQNGAKWWL